MLIKCNFTDHYDTLNRQIANPLGTAGLELKKDMNVGKSVWLREMHKCEWHKLAYYNHTPQPNHMQYDFVK
jgi:hypothetical protein